MTQPPRPPSPPGKAPPRLGKATVMGLGAQTPLSSLGDNPLPVPRPPPPPPRRTSIPPPPGAPAHPPPPRPQAAPAEPEKPVAAPLAPKGSLPPPRNAPSGFLATLAAQTAERRSSRPP